MLILIIQSFDTDKKVGHRATRSLRKLFEELFIQHGESDVKFMERNYDQLGDLVVDWEHEQLHHTAEDHCLNFDHIDMIIITGDLSTLPWEPQAMQLVSLIHMAKFSNKPLIGVGFGAFATIYSLATKGARFNILNGPEGELIDQLSKFQRYSIGTGAFPSGWLDKETGDVYTFRKADMSWHPVCNVGIHSVDLKKDSILDNESSLPKTYLSNKEDYKTIGPSHQMTITKKSDSSILHFNPKLLQHKFIRNLPVVKNNFNVKVFHEWRLNRDGSLPPGENLLILGEGKTGPLILARESMLLLAMRYEHCPETENANIVTMISNFIGEFLMAFRTSSSGKIERSMHEFLFGEVNREGDYDTTHHRKPMAPPLARHSVATKWDLPRGPVKTDPPAMDMFFRSPKTALDFDFTILTAKRRSSHVGKKPRQAIQNPLSGRQKRLEKALQTIGYLDQHKSIEKSISESKKSDPYELQSLMPESNRDMLAGIVMNDSSITSRRHRNVEYQRFYESIFPKGPPLSLDNNRVTSSMFSSSLTSDSPHPPHNALGNSLGIFSLSEPSATQIPVNNNAQSPQSKNRSGIPSRVRYADDLQLPLTDIEGSNGDSVFGRSQSPVPIRDLPAELRTYSPAFLEAHRKSIFTKAKDQDESLLPWKSPKVETQCQQNSMQVPTIANWVEVFKVTGAGNRLQQQDITSSSVPNTARSFKSIDSSHQSPRIDSRAMSAARSTSCAPPSSARSSGSTSGQHRKHRIMTSPRTAEDIMVAKVQSYLPAHHPAAIQVNYVEERVIQPSHHSNKPVSKPNPNTLVPKMSGAIPPSSPTSSRSGTPLKPPYYGKSAYSESKRLEEQYQQKQRSTSVHSISSHHSLGSNDDSEDEDPVDSNGLVDGVVKIVPQSALPPSSAISFYQPPETEEEMNFRTNHIPRILQLSAKERITSPAQRAQTAAAARKSNSNSSASVNINGKYRKPYSNYHKIIKMKNKNVEASTYEGTYTTGEYRSEEERYRVEQILNKDKCLAGEFKTCFSQHNTEMVVRPEGLVRASGPYPDPPNFAVPATTKACDWVYMKDLHPAGELLAGQWK